MIFGTVSASERTAPVHGEQPSERMRHITVCGFSPGSSGTNGCSSRDQRVAAHDDLALLGEVERHDRDVLDVDVAARRRARSSSRAGTRGCSRPGRMRLFSRCQSSGRWFFGSHWPLRVAEREDALLGARALLVAPGAAERRVEVARLERVEQRLGLEQRRSSAACRPRTAACRRRSPPCSCGRSAARRSPRRTGRGTRSSRGTCRSCRRAAAGTESGPG